MTITLTRKEAQMVLDALNAVWKIDRSTMHNKAIELLRARLAQPEHVSYAGNGTAGMEDMTAPTGFFFQMPKPEPEPVAWHEPGAYGNVTVYKDWAKENGWLPLYTTSPQREWQGLTDEEIIDVIHPLVMADMPDEATDYEIAKAIEAKLKEKNASHL
jgi:hypothetical protein